MSEPSDLKNLFRENALKSLDAPDEDLASSLEVIQPRSWVLLMLLLLLFFTVIIWAVWWKLDRYVSAPGILLSMKQFQYAENLIKEKRQDHLARLNRIKLILENKRQLYKQHYLSIIDLQKAEEEYIATKNHMNPYAENAVFSSFISENNTDLYSLIFVKNMEGKNIKKGMIAYVLPDILSQYEYGYLKGVVVDITRYPASKEAVYSYLGNMNLVDDYFYGGSPFLVKIKLDKDEKTRGGYVWTANRGKSVSLDAGMTVTAKIIYQSSTPLKLLIHAE